MVAPFEGILKCWIQDSGRGFRIPVTQFRIPLEGFRISRAKFWISKPWIPSSTSKNFLDAPGKNGNGL